MTARFRCEFPRCTSMLAAPSKWGTLCPTHRETVSAVASMFFSIIDRRDDDGGGDAA